MPSYISKLHQDEDGTIDIVGYILLVTILGIGLIAGLATLRDGIIQEYGDLSVALEQLNQSYEFTLPDPNGPPGATTTIVFNDGTTPANDPANAPPAGINLSIDPIPGEDTSPPGGGMGEGPGPAPVVPGEGT